MQYLVKYNRTRYTCSMVWQKLNQSQNMLNHCCSTNKLKDLRKKYITFKHLISIYYL